jgi:2-polyprenyl-3-methyl-5-hydroxy-6-metoxy-1,4-benzoquinol methylase
MLQEPSRQTEARRSLRETARRIFGDQDPGALEQWVAYWEQSRDRNAGLLEQFQRIVALDFAGKRVLDIGCGTGGLGEIVEQAGGEYYGGDNHSHVLRFAESRPGRRFLQCSGVDLPFRNRSFDYIFAFDIIEHVSGGRRDQHRFLRELTRVLKPLGMIFLTTPNRWYPWEGHTQLYFPQYLPSFMRDRYIGRRNPGFLKEHRSFSEIPLLTPRALEKLARASGLTFLHDLPCALDRREFLRLHPLYGWIAYLGLGWLPHAEFWGVLCRRDLRPALRLKLKNSWYYEKNQPGDGAEADFGPLVDFRRGPCNAQLGGDWHWYEGRDKGFRWTGQKAVCYLQAEAPVRYCRLEGYFPTANQLEVQIRPIPGRGLKIGECKLHEPALFRLEFLIPFPDTSDRMYEVQLRCRAHLPDNPADKRELGAMVFSIGLR